MTNGIIASGSLVTIATANPDEGYPVPEKFDEINPPVFKSKSSEYFCKPPHRFIVDIKMATYSNTDPVMSGDGWVPSNPEGKMLVFGMPWDVPGSYLPSTGNWRDIRIALKDDTDRLQFFWTVLLKHGDGPFSEIVHQATLASMTASWSAASRPPYGIPPQPMKDVSASKEGWDTYRFAVACRMRGVAQRVAVSFASATPE